MRKLGKKQVYKKSIIVFICLLIIGNLVPWNVLCLGADGHVEVESAFNDCCNSPDHSSLTDSDFFSSTEDHEMCKYCGPCIDIPIINDIVLISKTTQELNLKDPAPTTCFLVDSNNFNYTEYHLASKSFSDTSFYIPLCTVILQI